MAEVTVSQLAEVVGTPVDRLLKQMKEAGLKHQQADEVVSDDDKQVLLAFLKNSHGESTAAPKKITLKRKTLSTLKTGSGAAKKTVSVEVRKKRTYVKRDPAELAQEAAEAEAADAAAAGAKIVPPISDAPVLGAAHRRNGPGRPHGRNTPTHCRTMKAPSPSLRQ